MTCESYACQATGMQAEPTVRRVRTGHAAAKQPRRVPMIKLHEASRTAWHAAKGAA